MQNADSHASSCRRRHCGSQSVRSVDRCPSPSTSAFSVRCRTQDVWWLRGCMEAVQALRALQACRQRPSHPVGGCAERGPDGSDGPTQQAARTQHNVSAASEGQRGPRNLQRCSGLQSASGSQRSALGWARGLGWGLVDGPASLNRGRAGPTEGSPGRPGRIECVRTRAVTSSSSLLAALEVCCRQRGTARTRFRVACYLCLGSASASAAVARRQASAAAAGASGALARTKLGLLGLGLHDVNRPGASTPVRRTHRRRTSRTSHAGASTPLPPAYVCRRPQAADRSTMLESVSHCGTACTAASHDHAEKPASSTPLKEPEPRRSQPVAARPVRYRRRPAPTTRPRRYNRLPAPPRPT